MIKDILKKIIPVSLWQSAKRVRAYNKIRDNIDVKYSGKSISNIFSEIYTKDEWGKGNEGKFKIIGTRFYSGSGSYNKAAFEYIKFIDGFIKKNNIKSVTDIGCGDFNIGKQILKLNPEINYNGVDVVQELVDYNNNLFANERVRFYCLDTLHDTVPQSDLLLIRQVLQHLSNADIAKLTKNCFHDFTNILVTEHQLKPELLVKKNIDKETGPNIRLGFGSGVYLNSSPFNYQWVEKLVAEDPDNNRFNVVTYLIEK